MNPDKEGLLAICSEFSDTYGFDISDLEKLVIYTKSKYINELKNILNKKEYKLAYFEVYGDEALINFIPNKTKSDGQDNYI